MTKRRLLLLGIVLLAATFRLPRIGHDSFWQDEVLTGQSATAPFLEVVPVVRQMENAPPLYFLLMNCWARVFGSSDVALRVPSALAGIGAVTVIAATEGAVVVSRAEQSLEPFEEVAKALLAMTPGVSSAAKGAKRAAKETKGSPRVRRRKAAQ